MAGWERRQSRRPGALKHYGVEEAELPAKLQVVQPSQNAARSRQHGAASEPPMSLTDSDAHRLAKRSRWETGQPASEA